MNRAIIKEEAMMLLHNPIRLKQFSEWTPQDVYEKELKQAVLTEYNKLYKESINPQ